MPAMMPHKNVKRLVLLEELRLVHAEAACLREMLTVLQATHTLDTARQHELLREWQSASDRASELSAELRALD